MSNAEVDIEVHEDPAHHIEFGALTSTLRILGFSVILYGWTATETSGSAAAALDVYDTDSATGVVVLPIRLASGESAESWYGDRGILFRNGVFLNVTTGSVKGSLFYRHHRY